RRNRVFFAHWAQGLFELPGPNILGAYRDNVLCAVSLSLLVDGVLIYASFLSDTPSLRLGVADLLFHKVREAVSSRPDVRQLFAGGYHSDDVSRFYLLRGCRVLRKPAVLVINPLATIALREFFPNAYAKLHRANGVHGDSESARMQLSED